MQTYSCDKMVKGIGVIKLGHCLYECYLAVLHGLCVLLVDLALRFYMQILNVVQLQMILWL